MVLPVQKPLQERFDVEETYWDEVRDQVSLLNPELAKVCDEISPGREHPLLKIRYPYGAKIVDKGEFYLPNLEGGIESLRSETVNEDLRQKISYSTIPLSLVLHNDTEVFGEVGHKALPLNFFRPGDLFGVFECMNFFSHIEAESSWSVSAGGRSVFMIPRITDKIGHNRMRKQFGFSFDEPPADLHDHWRVFKGIYEGSRESKKWYNEILVFTDRWFRHEGDPIWLRFQLYICKLCWSQYRLFRQAREFSALWSSFVEEMSNRSLRPRPYLIDTLKYLLLIAEDMAVAFKPATTETALPVSLIQEAYVTHYNLKNYIPTIMQPCKLKDDTKVAYYSLALPTVLESTPYVKNAPSIMEDERDIKRLLDVLLRTIKTHNMTFNPLQGIKCDFFHSDVDQYGEILSSQFLDEGDEGFQWLSSDLLKGRNFCPTSPFFKGCIRLSRHSNMEGKL